MRHRPFWWSAVVGFVVTLAVVGLVRAAGSSGGDRPKGPPPEVAQPPFLYVAVGASDAVGVGSDAPARDSWPQVFRRDGLRSTAEIEIVAQPGATTADAVREQLPIVLRRDPKVVTVWLGVNDALRAVPPADFERNLAVLLDDLTAGGATVLIGNVPTIDSLPIYVQTESRRRHPGMGALLVAYDDAVERLAATHGAHLVDLKAAAKKLAQADSDVYISNDGFHPSSEGHAAIAARFVDVYERVAATG